MLEAIHGVLLCWSSVSPSYLAFLRDSFPPQSSPLLSDSFPSSSFLTRGPKKGEKRIQGHTIGYERRGMQEGIQEVRETY